MIFSADLRDSEMTKHARLIARIKMAAVLLVTAFVVMSCTGRTAPATAPSSSSSSVPGQSTSSTTSSNTPQARDSNALTDERVRAAVQKAFNKLVRSEQMAAGATASVLGIQEIPAANAAKADLDLTNAAFLQTDMLSGKWEVGPGGFGGRMVYSKKRIRIDHCTANLKHYTNGKWILESLDTHSYEFGVLTVNVAVD